MIQLQPETDITRPSRIAGGELLLGERGDLEAIESIWRRLWSVTCPAPPMLEFRWVQQWSGCTGARGG